MFSKPREPLSDNEATDRRNRVYHSHSINSGQRESALQTVLKSDDSNEVRGLSSDSTIRRRV